MSNDPIVDEVREIRAEILEEHGFDLRAYSQKLMLEQKVNGQNVVTRRSQRVAPFNADQHSKAGI